jgi:hypothetical protein
VGLTGVIPKTRIGSRAYPIIEAGVPVLAVGKLLLSRDAGLSF